MKSGARIVGGRFGGRRLDVAAGVRPTSARIREAMANIWSERLAGARLLDCFAGSGAFSVELVGRGVARATLVERAPKVLSTLRRNLQQLESEQRGGSPFEIVRADLPAGAHRLVGPFDLIFADPPYAFDDHTRLLTALQPLVSAEGQVVVEHGRATEIAAVEGLEAVDHRRYGDTELTFFDVRRPRRTLA